MTERLPDTEHGIDLADADFRHVLTKPLGPVPELRRSIIIFGFATVLTALGGWQIGGILGAFLPIPTAIWLGAGIAGLRPAWFFGKPD